MNRFSMYDRVEQERQRGEDSQVKRDEWIRNKADELAESFPQCAMDFYPQHKGFSPYRVGLDSDAAQDAYAAYVDTVCLAKAEWHWEVAHFMGEVA